METPKKPIKKTSTSTKSGGVKKTIDKPEIKPKSRFIDDDEDDEFDEPLDDLAGFDNLDELEEDDF